MRKAKVLSILYVVVLLAVSITAGAQQAAKIPRLGALLYTNPETDPNFAAFRQGLREHGYIEGQNLLIEHHSAEQKPQRLPQLAGELVHSKPNLIFALGGDVVAYAQKATKAIPIVMWVSNDPVAMGFVVSLAPTR